MASVPDLQCGFSRDLFLAWCGSPKNSIILTNRTSPGTLARWLIDNPENKTVTMDVSAKKSSQNLVILLRMKEISNCRRFLSEKIRYFQCYILKSRVCMFIMVIIVLCVIDLFFIKPVSQQKDSNVATKLRESMLG